jgi:flagella synthesis protein FlgN
MVHEMEARSRQRVALATALIGRDATMSKVISLQKGAQREALESSWKLLENMVREAKQLNERNCKLMMDQHGIMQRVLHGEEHIYAPE